MGFLVPGQVCRYLGNGTVDFPQTSTHVGLGGSVNVRALSSMVRKFGESGKYPNYGTYLGFPSGVVDLSNVHQKSGIC